MTNFPAKKESSPQDEVPPADDSSVTNLHRLKLKLFELEQGLRAFDLNEGRTERRGPSSYLIGFGDDDDDDRDDPKSEKFSVFSYGDDDDDAQSLFRCPYCDFEIEFSVLRTRLQGVHCFDPKNKVCPVCDKKIGEDAVGIPQHSNSRKRTMRFEKSSIGDLGMIDHKLASWGNKHYPVSDPPLLPFSF